MIGTTFLWVYWPSFVAAPAGPLDQASAIARAAIPAPRPFVTYASTMYRTLFFVAVNPQERAIIATVLSLSASCVSAFIMSLVLRGGKFSMVDVQNATLAGGVAIGTAANLHVLSPVEAIIIGCLGGILSVVGYTKIQPKLESVLGIHDTCGVNNLHGMPAILAALASALILGYTAISDFASPAEAVASMPSRLSFNGTGYHEDRSAGEQVNHPTAHRPTLTLSHVTYPTTSALTHCLGPTQDHPIPTTSTHPITPHLTHSAPHHAARPQLHPTSHRLPHPGPLRLAPHR